MTAWSRTVTFGLLLAGVSAAEVARAQSLPTAAVGDRVRVEANGNRRVEGRLLVLWHDSLRLKDEYLDSRPTTVSRVEIQSLWVSQGLRRRTGTGLAVGALAGGGAGALAGAFLYAILYPVMALCSSDDDCATAGEIIGASALACAVPGAVIGGIVGWSRQHEAWAPADLPVTVGLAPVVSGRPGLSIRLTF